MCFQRGDQRIAVAKRCGSRRLELGEQRRGVVGHGVPFLAPERRRLLLDVEREELIVPLDSLSSLCHLGLQVRYEAVDRALVADRLHGGGGGV